MKVIAGFEAIYYDLRLSSGNGITTEVHFWRQLQHDLFPKNQVSSQIVANSIYIVLNANNMLGEIKACFLRKNSVWSGPTVAWQVQGVQIIENCPTTTFSIYSKYFQKNVMMNGSGLCTTFSWMKQEQAEFHNIVLWGKLAEIAAQYLGKWKKVYVEGRLQTRTWEAQDWTKRYKTEIVWTNLIMLDKNGWADVDHATPSSWPANNTPSVKKTKAKGEEEISIADIPF